MAYRYLIFIAAPLLAQEFHNPVVIPNSSRTDRGTLEFRTANDARGVKLRSASSMAGDYTMDLPDALGASGDCLKLIATSVLGFGACGSGGGWTLTTDELSPVDTSATLRVVRSTNGQGMGSFAKPWSGVWSTTFQAPNAAGTDAKMTLNSTSLTGADTGGNTKVSIVFNSGSISTQGTITSTGVSGADHDAWYLLKNAALGGSNWRWALSHRADGKQLWFYAYDGTNFSIPLKLNPTGNSVCVNCPGDVTPGYSLDVGGQALVTGLKASGAGGYVNAAQVEVRDPSTNFHWGIKATVQTVGERSIEFRDSNAVVPMKMWTMQSGGLRTAVDIYGELQAQDIIPDSDAVFDSGRLLGSASRRWYQTHALYTFTSNLTPKLGTSEINVAGDLVPVGTRSIGNSTFRVGSIHVTNLDVSGTCTGCGGGGGGWTSAGSTLYPTSNTSGLEVLPNPTTSPANSQSIGSGTAPWSAVLTKAVTIPHTTGAFYRSNLAAGGLTLANTSGVDTFYMNSASGNAQNIGGFFVYDALSDFSPVVSLTKTTFSHTAYAGGGNASLCVDSGGVVYRGTPGC